jgi:hypothetical protein
MTSPTEIDLMGARQTIVVPPAAYTVAPTDTDLVGTRDNAGLAVTLNVVTPASGASVLVQVLGVDNTSGATWLIGAMVALTGTGTTTLRIHPANPTAAVSNGVQTQQGQIPDRVRIHVIQGNGTSTTYSVGAALTC